MAVCRGFTTTPDVAASLLAPSMRPLTLACLDVVRGERVVEEFRSLDTASDDGKAEILGRWRDNGDGKFFADLMRAAGREQPALDEL